MICAGVHCIFRAHPWFRGKPCHNWAYVEYVDEDSRGKGFRKFFLSLILGFEKFQDDDKVMAVVRTEKSDVPWEHTRKDFFSSF